MVRRIVLWFHYLLARSSSVVGRSAGGGSVVIGLAAAAGRQSSCVWYLEVVTPENENEPSQSCHPICKRTRTRCLVHDNVVLNTWRRFALGARERYLLVGENPTCFVNALCEGCEGQWLLNIRLRLCFVWNKCALLTPPPRPQLALSRAIYLARLVKIWSDLGDGRTFSGPSPVHIHSYTSPPPPLPVHHFIYSAQFRSTTRPWTSGPWGFWCMSCSWGTRHLMLRGTARRTGASSTLTFDTRRWVACNVAGLDIASKVLIFFFHRYLSKYPFRTFDRYIIISRCRRNCWCSQSN